MKRIAVLVCLTLSAFVAPLSAQGRFPDDNGAALKGVTDVDARFMVSVWLGEDTPAEAFVDNGQSAFELGLRRDGVVVDRSARNYLICSVAVAPVAGGFAVAFGLDFYDYAREGVHALKWTGGGMLTQPEDEFDADFIAGLCVDLFANEWLKQNPS